MQPQDDTEEFQEQDEEEQRLNFAQRLFLGESLSLDRSIGT
jgi:hypothetical protein